MIRFYPAFAKFIIHPTLLSTVTLMFAATADAQSWFNSYKPLAEINSKLDQWTSDYANLATPLTIGQSWEGRDIRGVRLSTGGTNKPTLLLNGTQHAREWISPMTNMFAGEQLLSGYGSNADITEALDQVDVVILPVVNPDGYEYSWTTDRYWRKNRRPIGFNGDVGVDLNRNWDFGWGLDSGSSDNPESNVYRGPEPFSEPETAAMRDFYQANQNIVFNVDFHAYSQLILYPFGFTDQSAPADEALMVTVASQLSSSIQSVHDEFYDPISAHDLYLASGVSIDWTYGDQGVYSYTIELRPETFDPGFELPADEILPTGEENFPAIMDLFGFTIQLTSGDFNLDAIYDCADINLLIDAVLHGTNKAEFDLNQDGSIDTSDLPTWLANAGEAMLGPGRTFLDGDANLDGFVDGVDFIEWNNHKFTDQANWCHGDFNADGVVDGVDFIVWNENKFTVSDAAAVPEPTIASLLIVVGLLGGSWRRPTAKWHLV